MSGGAPTGCPAVPPEFTPSDIYGLRLWVDASDTSTIVKVPVLNTITSIADKSGNNLILTSLGLNLPTYNATGFNGKPTITMTNKNGLKLTSPEDLFSSQNSNFTFFFVGHQESTENENYLIDFEQDGWRFSLNLNMLGENFWYRQNTTLHSGSTHDGNVYASWVFNDGDDPEASLFINGNLVESNNSYNATTLNKSCINIGQACISGTPMDFSGEISEILMFNRALIPQERESVENYLKNKWGL